MGIDGIEDMAPDEGREVEEEDIRKVGEKPADSPPIQEDPRQPDTPDTPQESPEGPTEASRPNDEDYESLAVSEPTYGHQDDAGGTPRERPDDE